MIAYLALLAVIQSSQPLADTDEPVSPQVAAERVAQCRAGSVTIRPADDADGAVLAIASNGAVTDEQLACIDKAAEFYDVTLPAPMQPRFEAIREARAAAVVAADSRRWLSARGLLTRLPTYTPGTTRDIDFARQIEDLCDARGAFSPRYGFHAVDPDWATQHSDPRAANEPLACIFNAAWVSGYEMGFIGNEADPADR